jgi:hypothetical protein
MYNACTIKTLDKIEIYSALGSSTIINLIKKLCVLKKNKDCLNFILKD